MKEANPNTVKLTPSHFFDRPGDCWRRNGREWRQNDCVIKVLHPDVFWWLRENVGYELNECWDVDRHFYPDEERPELPRGGGGAWIAAGRKSFYGIKHHDGEYSLNRSDSQIYFPEVRHARAFRERFQIWHDTWDTMILAARRRYDWSEDRKLCELVRNRETAPYGVASHALQIGDQFRPLEAMGLVSYARDHPTHGMRRFYFLDDDQDRVMFLLSCQAEDPMVFIARASALTTPAYL